MPCQTINRRRPGAPGGLEPVPAICSQVRPRLPATPLPLRAREPEARRAPTSDPRPDRSVATPCHHLSHLLQFPPSAARRSAGPHYSGATHPMQGGQGPRRGAVDTARPGCRTSARVQSQAHHGTFRALDGVERHAPPLRPRPSGPTCGAPTRRAGSQTTGEDLTSTASLVANPAASGRPPPGKGVRRRGPSPAQRRPTSAEERPLLSYPGLSTATVTPG